MGLLPADRSKRSQEDLSVMAVAALASRSMVGGDGLEPPTLSV